MNLSGSSLSLGRRAALCCGAVLAAAMLAPQAAPAAVSCNHDGAFHAVTVSLTAAGDYATIMRNANGTIGVNLVPCGAANVDNTDAVYVSDVSGGDTTVELDVRAGAFAPGYTDEGELFGSEIEFWLDLGAGQHDTAWVRGEQQGTTLALGSQGINLNVAAEPLPGDADVWLGGVESVVVYGSPVDDWISAEGGHGTGQPSGQHLNLVGLAGNDELRSGGASSASLSGHAGDDMLVGGAHFDYLEGGPGNDTISGGGGPDKAAYVYAPSGVSVDLSVGGPRDTRGAGIDTIAGVELLTGSKYDDVLIGDGGDNDLKGGDGNDVLDALAGADSLYGGAGSDTLRGGPGDDTQDGGEGADTVVYDDAPAPVQLDLGVTGVAQATGGSGAETLTTIENAIGSPFADRLIGSAGANALGGAGADTIEGGEGADTLAGGAGPDAIDSRDTSPDSLSCGEGPDSLATDALDTIAPDCAPAPPPGAGSESNAAPGAATGTIPGAGSGSTGASGPALTLSVPPQSLRRVRATGLRVTVRCSADCRASGRLLADRTTARRLGLGTTAARRTLGRLTPIALAAASTRGVRVPLTASARRALRAHRPAAAPRARSRRHRARRRARAQDRDPAPCRLTHTPHGRRERRLR
jgi:Ca2+-binding RTX toxin-like protein